MPLKSDICVHMYKNDDMALVIRIRVDVLSLCENKLEHESEKKRPMGQLRITLMGITSLVPSMKVTRDSTKGARQAGYTKSVPETLDMGSCDARGTPELGAELQFIGHRNVSARTKHGSSRCFYIRELEKYGIQSRISDVNHVIISENEGAEHLSQRRQMVVGSTPSSRISAARSKRRF